MVGIPNWEERTKHQRFSERVKTHGYPLGFAKSQHSVRDRLVDEQRSRIDGLSEEARLEHSAAHEAVAWALDAERVLGSFNQGERGGFPVDAVDRVTDQVLAWLDHRGYQVVPKVSGGADGETAPGEPVHGSGGVTMDLAASVDESHGQQENDAELDGDEENEDQGEDEEGVQYEGPDGSEWLSEADLDERLGTNRVPCLMCDGQGQVDGNGPVSWSCPRCLGSGRMPASAIEECLEALEVDGYEWHDENLSGLDFGGMVLTFGTFYGCNFSHVNFAAADMSSVEFHGCDLTGSNPEDAVTLDDAVFRAVVGLSDEQVAACDEMGARFTLNGEEVN